MIKKVLVHFVDHDYIVIPFLVWEQIGKRMSDRQAGSFQTWYEGKTFKYAINIKNVTYVEPFDESDEPEKLHPLSPTKN